jgi:glycosyltransferase involved in cell wall biosynthesis
MEKENKLSKKLLFIGFAINKKQCELHKGPAVSANRMHLGFIEALEKMYKRSLSIISIYPIACFPRERQIYIRREKINIINSVDANKIPFINILILKQLSQFLSVLFSTLLEISNKRIDTIITYNAHFETARPALLAAKIKKCKVIGLIADIITTVPPNYGFIKRTLRKWEIKSYHKTISDFDGLIVLNEKVIDAFALSIPYVIMDGGVSDEEIINTNYDAKIKHENTILYTGALEPYNGIEELIEGFTKVKNEKLQLLICGHGTLHNYVEQQSSIFNNIKYLGQVTNEQAKELQNIAGLLINTRPIDLFATKLTFPSKIIEYMLSGTPVLTTPLNGLTEDYFPYLYFCGQAPSEVAKGINYVMSLPANIRNEKGKRAREFIVDNKTYANHVKRIIPFIEKL